MAENIDDRTLKASAKWRNYPSILELTSEYKNRANFTFNFVSKEDVLTEIKVLDVSKAIHHSFRLKLLRQMKISLQKQFDFPLINL